MENDRRVSLPGGTRRGERNRRRADRRDRDLSGGLSGLSGSGNLGSDPRFANEAQGNLRLNADSSCLDSGFDLVDLDPLSPGLQLLPAEDLVGARRIADGDGVPGARVDLGAYERQP